MEKAGVHALGPFPEADPLSFRLTTERRKMVRVNEKPTNSIVGFGFSCGGITELQQRMAGIAAADVVFGSKSKGAGGNAGGDLVVATRIAFRFAGSYGLGKSLRYHGDADSVALCDLAV